MKTVEQNKQLNNILNSTFQANREFDLILYDRLPRDQQQLLADLRKDPSFYGVLQSRAGGSCTTKSVCKETALLYYSLLEPGPLPAYARTDGAGCNQAIAQLVLDGILCIERNGKLVSGSNAFGLIYGDCQATLPENTISRLSREAIQYAQRLKFDDTNRLASRLYLYNRIPLSPAWAAKFATGQDVEDCLGVSQNPILGREWWRVRAEPPNDGWFAWQLKRPRDSQSEPARAFKLYISPQPRFVRQAFDAAIPAITEAGARHFKIGNSAAGLLRPDKMVAYFDSWTALAAASESIGRNLSDCPAQGVPFSAELAGNGLLSWGVDPPPEEGAPSWLQKQSWRLWIANRLAVSLTAAKQDSGAVEPWQFAVERLRLEGVNTDTWTPGDGMWN